MTEPGDPRGTVRGTVDDELQHHLESRTRELIEAGVPPEEARRRALVRLGDIEEIRSQVLRASRSDTRRRRIRATVDETTQDLRLGFRRLLGTPVFTLVAAATLALGVGANGALFSVIRTVVMQPLPFASPEDLIQIWESAPDRGWDTFMVSAPNYLDFRERAREAAAMGAAGTTSFNLTGGEAAEHLDAYRISASLLPVLGVEPLYGRGFTPEEDAPGAPGDVALLGYELWQRRYAGDPDVVGREVLLDDRAVRVVGVLPRLHPLFYGDAIFVPLAEVPDDNRSNHELMVVGRLSPGLSIAGAEEKLDAVAAELAVTYPDSNAGFDTRVMSLHDGLVPAETRSALYILLGAVGLVLLIACANLSNLMLARATARQRSLALYAALGASRGRLVRQLVTEALIVSTAGLAAGLWLAWRATTLLRSARLEGIPRIDEVALDLPVIAVTAAVALSTGLLAGLLPALRATGSRLAGLIGDAGRGSVGDASTINLRRSLVIAEVALSVVLLTGSGLLLRSLLLVQAEDPGIDVERILTMELSVPISADEESLRWVPALYGEMLAAVEATPSVQSAAAISGLPFGGGSTVMDFVVEGEALEPGGVVPSAQWRLITPDYFETAGIELVSGRGFRVDDDLDGQQVVVISRRMAERHWPGEDPLGRRFFGWRDPERPLTVIGIVEDVRERSLEAEAVNVVYLPYYANPWWKNMFLLTRTTGPPASAAADVRAALARVAPSVPVSFVRPLHEVVADSLAPRRFSTALLGAFAAIALTLTAAGVFGVVSYGVARRRAEIGVRVAMGARREQVVRLVVVQGMAPVLVGATVGLVGAFAVTRLLGSQLYAIGSADPLTYLGVAVFLGTVAVAACAVPAVRASRVDPVETLRDA